MAAGGVVTVSLVIVGGQDVYGIDVRARFDPSVIEIVDADAAQAGVQLRHGSFLQPDFVVRNAADNVSGTLQYVVTQISPSAPANGEGVIVTVVLRGKTPGWQSALTIETVVLANRDGVTLPVAIEHGTVTVTGGADETPAPTATTAPPAVATATAVVAPPTATSVTLQATATPTGVPPVAPPTRTQMRSEATPTRTAAPAASATATATATAVATPAPMASPGAAAVETQVVQPTVTPQRLAPPSPTSAPAAPTVTMPTMTPGSTDTGGTTAWLRATSTVGPAAADVQAAAAPTRQAAQPGAVRSAPLPLGPAPAVPQRPAILGLDLPTLLGMAMIALGIIMLVGLFYVSFRER